MFLENVSMNFTMFQKRKGISLDEYIARVAAITAIENLKYLADTTFLIDLVNGEIKHIRFEK